MKNKKEINAGIIIIGNEVLSGRTKDINTSTLSLWLNSLGVQVKEVRIIPDIEKYMFLIASWQIRTRATLGGNIINASPIGDMTILLMALDSLLVLQNGTGSRKVPLTSFYKGYKQLDKTDSEILTEILIPSFSPDTKIHFEKIDKTFNTLKQREV